MELLGGAEEQLAALRRILKGEEIPAIHPLVDLSNTLSTELAVPCCVMSGGGFRAAVSLSRRTTG